MDKTSFQKVAAAIRAKIKPLAGDEDDIESGDALISALEAHIEGITHRYLEGVQGFRRVFATTVPCYGHESMAEAAALAGDLNQIGERIGDLVAVREDGSILAGIPEKRDVLIIPGAQPEDSWSRWATQTRVGSRPSGHLGDPLSQVLETPRSTEQLGRLASIAAEPLIRFHLRMFPERAQRTLRTFITDSVQPIVAGHIEELSGAAGGRAAFIRAALDPDGIALTERAPGFDSVWGYNWFTAIPDRQRDQAEELKRYRSQAVEALGNLASLISSAHEAPVSSRPLLRAIDEGSSLLPVLSTLAPGFKKSHMRYLSKADPAVLDLDDRALTALSLKAFVAPFIDLPPERYPKTVEDGQILRALEPGFPAVARIAAHMDVEPQALWSGLLKKGWADAVHALASEVIEDLPATAVEQAAVCAGALHEVADRLDMIHGHLLATGRRETAADDMAALLHGRTLTRIALRVRQFRGEADRLGALAPPTPEGLPDGCEWAPFLRTREITIGDTVLRELVNLDQLRAEGDRETGLSHCSGTYGTRCRTSGYRFFSMSRGQGRRTNTDERATCCIVLEGSGQEFTEHMTKGYRNNANSPRGAALTAVRDRFFEMIRDGSLDCDLDAYAKDIRRLALENPSEMQLRAARLEAENVALLHFAPRVEGSESLRDYLESPEHQSALAARVDQRANREAEAALQAAMATSSKQGGETMGFGFG